MLNRTISLRRFFWAPTTYIFMRNYTLLSGREAEAKAALRCPFGVCIYYNGRKAGNYSVFDKGSFIQANSLGPRSAVGSKFDCRSRGGSMMPARSHTSWNNIYAIWFSHLIQPFSSSRWFKKGCCQLQANSEHEVLVRRWVKLAQEKVWLGEPSRLDMTIAVDWVIKTQTKQNTLTALDLICFQLVQ